MTIREDQVWALMARAGIPTQVDLAAAVGLHPVSLNKVLRGRTQPGMETVDRLCSVLHAQPGDILIHK